MNVHILSKSFVMLLKKYSCQYTLCGISGRVRSVRKQEVGSSLIYAHVVCVFYCSVSIFVSSYIHTHVYLYSVFVGLSEVSV